MGIAEHHRGRLRCVDGDLNPFRLCAAEPYERRGLSRTNVVEETILRLKENRHSGLFIHPIGFLCDHVEVLYDVDVAFREFAGKQGMQLWRAPSLNDSALLTAALADLVHARLRSGQKTVTSIR